MFVCLFVLLFLYSLALSALFVSLIDCWRVLLYAQYVQFVSAAALLRAQVYGVEACRDETELRRLISDAPVAVAAVNNALVKPTAIDIDDGKRIVKIIIPIATYCHIVF
jgi:hypothetical protein